MYKLLIAEDEHLERKAVKFYINKFYSNKLNICGEAVNGEEAILKSLVNDVDIILMDINMPKINGLKAAGKIKEKLPSAEIIILSAEIQLNYDKLSNQIGISDYLLKPYLEEDFCRVIENSLENLTGKRII